MKASFTDFNKVIDIIKANCGASEDSAIKATSDIWEYFNFDAVETPEDVVEMMKMFLPLV